MDIPEDVLQELMKDERFQSLKETLDLEIDYSKKPKEQKEKKK